MNNPNVHYGNLNIISVHVEFITPSFFKLSFIKQANVSGVEGQNRGSRCILKKHTRKIK